MMLSETSQDLLKSRQEEVGICLLSFALPLSNGWVRLDYEIVTI